MRINLTVLLIWTSTCVLSAQNVPAFPGAEGFGAFSKGGRGGKIIFVNNLRDNGPGSLRSACLTKGPRMVIFRVAGFIDLESPLLISEPFITIAGQSAPGDGICIRGYGLRIETHDVIIRFIRCRAGDSIVTEREDALAIGGNSQRVIVDHCSIGWGTDETLSASDRISDISVQWCIIHEGLHHSIHHKGPHGMGTLARAIGGVTFHHNLWAHNNSRNPRLGDAYDEPPYPIYDVRNNVMYNYGSLCSGLTSGHIEVNYVGNYIKPGPDSDTSKTPIVLRRDIVASYFISGNIMHKVRNISNENKKMLQFQDDNEIEGDNDTEISDVITFLKEPLNTPKVRTTSAGDAYMEVLMGAGATHPVRDAIDKRIVYHVRSGTGAIIDSQDQVGGWPKYTSMRPLTDSDRDGMPDDWEIVHNLNPLDDSDHSSDRDKDGYTNIEEYLNALVK